MALHPLGGGRQAAGSDVGGDPDDDVDACLRCHAPLVGGSGRDHGLSGVELAGAQGRDDRLAGAEGTLIAREPLDGEVVTVRVGDNCRKRYGGAEALGGRVEDGDVR